MYNVRTAQWTNLQWDVCILSTMWTTHGAWYVIRVPFYGELEPTHSVPTHNSSFHKWKIKSKSYGVGTLSTSNFVSSNKATLRIWICNTSLTALPKLNLHPTPVSRKVVPNGEKKKGTSLTQLSRATTYHLFQLREMLIISHVRYVGYNVPRLRWGYEKHHSGGAPV